MKFNKIFYVDPTISSPGDGSTPAKALKNITKCESIVESALYIVRRTTTPLSLVGVTDKNGAGNSVTKKLGIWGMPTAEMNNYDAVPQDAKTAWGSDGNVKPQIKSDDANKFKFSNLYDLDLFNIELINTGTNKNSNEGGEALVLQK